jgi:hypothetical protein
MQGKGGKANGARGRSEAVRKTAGKGRGRRRAWSRPALAAARAFLAIRPVDDRAGAGTSAGRPGHVSRLVIDFYLGQAG